MRKGVHRAGEDHDERENNLSVHLLLPFLPPDLRAAVPLLRLGVPVARFRAARRLASAAFLNALFNSRVVSAGFFGGRPVFFGGSKPLTSPSGIIPTQPRDSAHS